MRDTPNNDCEGDYHVKNLQAIWFGATTKGNQMVDSGAKWTAVKQKGGQEGEGHDKELSPPPPPPLPLLLTSWLCFLLSLADHTKSSNLFQSRIVFEKNDSVHYVIIRQKPQNEFFKIHQSKLKKAT